MAHRNDQERMTRALRVYERLWPHEKSVVERFARLLKDWPRCLHRDRMPGHLTASAWVCDPEGEHVLFTHHRKLRRWVQLGGHADGEGDLPEVARREAREEAGATELVLCCPAGDAAGDAGPAGDPAGEWSIFDLDVHPIPPHGNVPAHLHFDVRFAYVVPRCFDPHVSEESIDVQWVPIRDLDSYTGEQSIRRMAEKWNTIVEKTGVTGIPRGADDSRYVRGSTR